MVLIVATQGYRNLPACRYARRMATPLTAIRNIGPASAQGFARAGIDSAEALRALGPDAAYAKLLASGAKPHFIGYYAMVMGLMGRPWNDCRGAEKVELRARFDAIVAQADVTQTPREGHDPGLEKLLNEIGLPAPGGSAD